MQLSAKDAWKRILDEAHRELPDHTIRTWLEPTEAIALDEGRLIIGAPDQFAVEWNETKHATLLSRLAEPVLGQPTLQCAYRAAGLRGAGLSPDDVRHVLDLGQLVVVGENHRRGTSGAGWHV